MRGPSSDNLEEHFLRRRRWAGLGAADRRLRPGRHGRLRGAERGGSPPGGAAD